MIRMLLLLLLALTSFGCMVGPDYVRPDVDVPEEWRFAYDDTVNDMANTVWWKQFEDPVLDELVLTALLNNRDVRIAAARVEEFAARLDVSRSSLFPQVGYEGSAFRDQASRETANGVPSGIDRTNDTFAATVNVGWELDLWGRIRRANEAARAEMLAADDARRAVILTLVSSVATSYVTLRDLDEQLDVARRTLDSRGESVRLFELKYVGGVVSQLEVAQIRSEYEQAAVRIPALEREIALLENALSVLLGLNPGPIARGKSINDLTLPRVPEGMPSDLLARRPDIQEAEQILIAANARIGVAKAEYFPRISLTGFLGYASDDLSNLVTGSASVGSIGASALGPIFTAGRIKGEVLASEAVQRQALVGYLQTIQTAFREVDDALISVRKSREELEVQGRRVDALTLYAELARERYDNGYVSFIEVLDADRRLFGAELEHVRSQGNVYTSLVNMYKAMGGGWIVEAQFVADQTDGASIAEDKP